jgi:hypothetical protein
VFFAICGLTEAGMRTQCKRLALIEPTLRALRHAIDTYLSQGTFTVSLALSMTSTPCRRSFARSAARCGSRSPATC